MMRRYFLYTGPYATLHVAVTNYSGVFIDGDSDRTIMHEYQTLYKELSVDKAIAMRMKGVEFFVSADVGGEE